MGSHTGGVGNDMHDSNGRTEPSAAEPSWAKKLKHKMKKLPAGVTVAEGAQATLNAVNEGRSTSDYWNHKGLRNGNFYSLTYEAPPDYSYGWALSGEVGYPFMLEAGIFTDSDLSQVEQMDSIASWMNTYFKNQKAVFSGSTPLKQVKAGKSHRWEGQVTLTENEKGITYKETWNVVLQISNAKIWLGSTTHRTGKITA